METILSIDSITVLHELAGYEKPKHPLISLIDISKIKPLTEQKDAKVRLEFYCVSLKTGIENHIRYGIQYYDFREVSLVFMAPNQVMTIDIVPSGPSTEGWMLCFHP